MKSWPQAISARLNLPVHSIRFTLAHPIRIDGEIANLTSTSTPDGLTEPKSPHFHKLKLGAFVAVLYAYCAAGPFGFEDMISTSGPGMSLLFLMIVPWLFALPMSLATSEMATAMPVEGGFYRWTRAAFGDFLGYQCGFWNWSGTFLMNAAYSVALADYTAQLVPTVAIGWRHWLVALFFLLLVAVLNILGVEIVGEVSIVLLLIVLIPVGIFTVVAFTHMQVNPFVPLTPPGKPFREVYGVGLALALWLFSGYEQLSTITEEVEKPERNFLLGLAVMVPLAMITFLLPIMAGIGAGADWQHWTSGHIVQIAEKVGGRWLELPMAAAAVISILLGLQTTLLSGARLPFTMAEDGFFHPALAKLHHSFGTPVRGILLSMALCTCLAVFSLPHLIAIYLWLRVSTSSLTLASVWRLRYIRPNMTRGFRIPGGTLGIAAVVLVPCCLFAWALINGERWTFLVGPAFMALAPISYAILRPSMTKQFAGAD